MFTSLDNHVTQLHRLGTEGMQLDDFNLDEGEFCSVTLDEINQAIFS
jgi:16S rRNA U516 pseudouridylate synthase RsuA-like enzyme